jgi:hypothetical protein
MGNPDEQLVGEHGGAESTEGFTMPMAVLRELRSPVISDEQFPIWPLHNFQGMIAI